MIGMQQRALRDLSTVTLFITLICNAPAPAPALAHSPPLLQEASQEDFFERSGAKALIDNLLAGLNVSLFCYGQVSHLPLREKH